MDEYKWNSNFFNSISIKNHFSAAYNTKKQYIKGKYCNLSSIEQLYMPNVSQKSILHVMCHVGGESIALANLGAKVTGIDRNPYAIDAAKMRSSEADLRIDYIYGDCRKANSLTNNKKFDVIYIGLGSLVWISDLNRFFSEMFNCLKDITGEIFLFDVHPLAQLKSSIRRSTDNRALHYFVNDFNYPIENIIKTSWTAESDLIEENRFFIWRHSMASIIQQLIESGFTIKKFAEHDGTTYQQFEELILLKNGLWKFKTNTEFPLTFTLNAIKNQPSGLLFK